MKILLTKLDESEFSNDVDASQWSREFLRIDALSWGQLSRWRMSRMPIQEAWSATWVMIQQFDRPWDRLCIWGSKSSCDVEALKGVIPDEAQVYFDEDAFSSAELKSLKSSFRSVDFEEAAREL